MEAGGAMESESAGLPEDLEFTDGELDMLADYTDALQARKNPDMEEYLKRCPGSEARMRPILETSLLLERELNRYRSKYPLVDLDKLLEWKRQSKAETK
jgi:hypothetical protein